VAEGKEANFGQLKMISSLRTARLPNPSINDVSSRQPFSCRIAREGQPQDPCFNKCLCSEVRQSDIRLTSPCTSLGSPASRSHIQSVCRFISLHKEFGCPPRLSINQDGPRLSVNQGGCWPGCAASNNRGGQPGRPPRSPKVKRCAKDFL